MADAPRVDRRWLWIGLALHFVLGGTYLAVLPLWGGVPDEPIHYSTIKYDAEFLRQPRITNPRPWGEPLSVYCFTADPVGAGGHGPLYYWSAVPLFELTRGLTVQQQLYVLRGWTLLFSALMIPFGWLLLRRLFPDDPGLVAAGTLTIALVPHRLMLSAVVYNDIACATASFGYLWLLLKASDDDGTTRDWCYAGLALGLAFLGKRVALVMIPGSVVALWLQQRRVGLPWQAALRNLGAWVGGAILVGGWWVLRDYRIYGELFPTEPGFEEQYQSWLTQWFALPHQLFWWKTRMIFWGLWVSLWSQDGWVPRDNPLGLGLYLLCGLGTLVAVCGYFGGLKRRWRGLSAPTRDFLTASFVMTLGMAYGAWHWVMQYSFHNHGETGKHAQAILVCLVALALAGWRWLLGPRRAVWAACVGVFLLLAFNAAAITHLERDLIPRWAPPTPALAHRRVKDLPSGRAPGIWHRYRVPGVEQEGGSVPRPSMPNGG